jgi:hypothetical protein
MGNGWAYTTFAILLIFSLEGSRQVMIHGLEWRKLKQEKANGTSQEEGIHAQ